MGINNAPININYFEPEIVEFSYSIYLNMIVRLTVNIINDSVQRRVADDDPSHDIRLPVNTQTLRTPSSEVRADKQLRVWLDVDRVRRGDVRQVGAREDSGAHEPHGSIRGLQVRGAGTREI